MKDQLIGCRSKESYYECDHCAMQGKPLKCREYRTKHNAKLVIGKPNKKE